MKPTFFSLLFFFVLGCSPGKNNETGADSTQAVTGAVVMKASAPIDPAKTSTPHFPTYSGEIFTEIENEASITRELLTLLSQYENKKFAAVKSRYSIIYQVENDYDNSTESAERKETKTWYYDSVAQLRAYTSEYKSDVDSTTTIYLFTNEKLTAAYMDNFWSGQDSGIRRERALNSQCPSCGVEVNLDNSDPLKILDNKHISYLSDTFFKDHKELLSDLKNPTVIKSKGDDRIINMQKSWDNKPYTIEYAINESLYNKLTTGN